MIGQASGEIDIGCHKPRSSADPLSCRSFKISWFQTAGSLFQTLEKHRLFDSGIIPHIYSYYIMEALLSLTADSYRQLNVTELLQLPMALINWASLPSNSCISLWQVIAVSSLALATCVVITGLLRWQRLKHIPGPAGAGWSKWWMLRNTLSGNMHLATTEACKKYGKRRLVSIPSVPTPAGAATRRRDPLASIAPFPAPLTAKP